MSYLKQLQYGELDERDMLWLLEATQISYTGLEPYHIFAGMQSGNLHLFRIDGEDARGVIVTKIIKHPALRELFILCMAGVGLVDIFEDAFPEIEDVAKEAKCTKIGCFIMRDAMKRLLINKLDFKTQLTHCLREVQNE